MTPQQQAWALLLLAIAAEVLGTTCMKLSHGFTRLAPSVGTGLCYLLSLSLLSLVLRHISVSTAYAVWSGVGTAAVAVIGMLAFREQVNVTKAACIVLIIIGAVGLKMLSSDG
jgi:small multidrug resistance pump